MHAFLVTGNNEGLLEVRVKDLVQELKAKRFDFAISKIADIRELGRFTRLALNEGAAIVLGNFDQATEESQNALLKNLEEPQENLFYILTATSAESVLSTIASRCQVIEIQNINDEIQKEDMARVQKFLKSSSGQKLVITAKITDRKIAVEFIKTIIKVLHKELQVGKPNVCLIEQAAQTLKNLEANGNVQLQLTNFVIKTSSN